MLITNQPNEQWYWYAICHRSWCWEVCCKVNWEKFNRHAFANIWMQAHLTGCPTKKWYQFAFLLKRLQPNTRKDENRRNGALCPNPMVLIFRSALISTTNYLTERCMRLSKGWHLFKQIKVERSTHAKSYMNTDIRNWDSCNHLQSFLL